MAKREPTLEELGLDKPATVKAEPAAPPAAPAPPSQQIPPKRPKPFPEPEPAEKPKRAYELLHIYIKFLIVMACIGNVVTGLLFFAAIIQLDFVTILNTIILWFSVNFLFVVATMVQLILDAKQDLSAIRKDLTSLTKR